MPMSLACFTVDPPEDTPEANLGSNLLENHTGYIYIDNYTPTQVELEKQHIRYRVPDPCRAQSIGSPNADPGQGTTCPAVAGDLLEGAHARYLRVGQGLARWTPNICI